MCIYLSLCIFTLSLFLSFSLAHQNPFCLSEPKSLFSFSFCKPSPHLLYFSSPSVCSVSTYILSLSLFLFLPLSLSFYLYLYLYLFLSTLSISFFFLSLVQPFSFHSLYLFLSRTTFFSLCHFLSLSICLSFSERIDFGSVIAISRTVFRILDRVQFEENRKIYSEPFSRLALALKYSTSVANSLLSQELKLFFSDTKFTKASHTKKILDFFLDATWDTEQYQILSQIPKYFADTKWSIWDTKMATLKYTLLKRDQMHGRWRHIE